MLSTPLAATWHLVLPTVVLLHCAQQGTTGYRLHATLVALVVGTLNVPAYMAWSGGDGGGGRWKRGGWRVEGEGGGGYMHGLVATNVMAWD